MSSIASLLFYLATLLFSTLCFYLGSKTSAFRLKIRVGSKRLSVNPALIFAILTPVLVAGFRYNVGTDFNNYLNEYNVAISGGSYLEVGFNLISNLSNVLFGSSEFMFTVFSLLTVLPVALAINKTTMISREYRWVFWMLFLFIMFPQTFNLLRQGASVGIGFYLLISVLESRKLISLKHILWLVLAACLHTSAWIVAPIAIVAHLMNNKRKRLMIMFIATSSVVAAVGFSLLPQILGWLGLWSGYLDNETVSRSVVPRSLLIFFILMVCWKYYSNLKITNSHIALLWMGLLASIGGIFVAYFERIGYYTSLLVPLLVLTLLAQSVKKSQATYVKLGLGLFALLYFVGIYYLMGSSDIFPYNWSI